MKWKEIIEFKRNLIKYLKKEADKHKHDINSYYNMTVEELREDEYTEDMDERQRYCVNFVLGEYDAAIDLLKLIEDGL